MLGIDHFSGDLTRYSPTGSADRMSAQGQSHVGFRRVRRWNSRRHLNCYWRLWGAAWV